MVAQAPGGASLALAASRPPRTPLAFSCCALADDRELRRYYARENDELTAHVEREVARTFVRAIPALAVVAIFAGALVSFEAMAAVAATLVFLSLALLAVKLSYRARLRAGAETE